jgi:hypothetical protein
MTMRTLTHGDLRQMAAATLSTSPTPQSERQAFYLRTRGASGPGVAASRASRSGDGTAVGNRDSHPRNLGPGVSCQDPRVGGAMV